MSNIRAGSMKVQALTNCFVAGYNYVDKSLIYTKHPEWASVVYTSEELRPITRGEALGDGRPHESGSVERS